MTSIQISLIFFLVFVRNVTSEDDPEVENTLKICRDKHILVGGNKSDLYKIVDVAERSKLELQCHYCYEIDDQQSKVWYKQDYLRRNAPVEVQLGMHRNLSLNRVHVTPQHTLIIQKVDRNDGGIYYCHRLNADPSEYKYNYLIDVVYSNGSNPVVGYIEEWEEYDGDYFKPVNALFLTSKANEFVLIRDKWKIDLSLRTEWEPWGVCVTCGRPVGHGERRRTGSCRIKITKHSTSFYNASINPTEFSVEYQKYFLVNSFEFSCHSITFCELFPDVGRRVRWIPVFVQIEHCEGVCDPGAQKGWKTWKSKDFKYRKKYVLAEGAHLVMACPESSQDKIIVWKKDGLTLHPAHSFQSKNKTEPKIIVDSFSTLYLQDVTIGEEGNYSCFVDDVRMQMNIVYVVSKSKLLTQAFLRHMIYLGFVMSLTLSCYCSGLFLAWKRRHTFKNYTQLTTSSTTMK